MKTKNIILVSLLALLMTGGVVFYIQGQHLDNKNVLGKSKIRSVRKKPTQEQMNQFIAKAIYSNTAYKNSIPNNPSEQERKNLIAVAENIYFPLVNGIGIAPKISSGYRGFALNKAVGGSITSQHMKGEAIDIDLENNNIDNDDIWRFIKNFLEFDQMIIEFSEHGKPSWIHVSYKRNGQNRRKINIAQKVNGKTVYHTFTEARFKKIYGYSAF